MRRGLRRMEWVAWLLDDAFEVPWVEKRFGLDGVLGLIPGAGDVLTGIFQFYLLIEAGLLGVQRRTLLRMLGNVLIDTTLGCIPLVGDIFDFVFKSSRINMTLTTQDLERRGPPEP
ncbi:MAG: DUF4112 domain-containing protein [Myxococcales bacterium]|nr:DUF4112 domain-containing protein [Myxococcales bacterium]